MPTQLVPSPSHAVLCTQCYPGYARSRWHQFSSCERPRLKASVDEHTSRHVRETESERRLSAKAKEKFRDRDFFLSVLNSTSTKREAKSYLQRFKPSLKTPLAQQSATDSRTRSGKADQTYHDPAARNRYGVNLGSLHVPAKAVEASPVFVQPPLPGAIAHGDVETLHLALVEIRAPQLLDNTTLQGIGQTLTQLGRLGLCSLVVIDCKYRSVNNNPVGTLNSWRKFAARQADRVVEAFEFSPGPGARRLDNVFGVAPASQEPVLSISLRSTVTVLFKDLLLAPLRRGIIPVITPVAYTAEQISVPVCPDDIMFALTREFAGVATTTHPDEDPTSTAEKIEFLQRQISLDRLIILDPLGGIPSPDRPGGAHVYINMEQEFEDIRNELLNGVGSSFLVSDAGATLGTAVLPLGDGPFSEFVETEIVNTPDRYSVQCRGDWKRTPHNNLAHLRNLELLKRTLSLLPPTSSALLTTPLEAANSGQPPSEPFRATGVGTRRQRNPLIHNLLTDKPIFSSSLPASRLPASRPVSKASQYSPGIGAGATATTFAKRGMPVTIIPDPRVSPWVPPDLQTKGLTFDDPRVDLPRLVNLIEDSFNRKLDVQHYLSRVNPRLAGLIIAGEYEGGAILTWETPPNFDDDCSRVSRRRLVPYLDKFAVLKRSQGAGGVADILFKAMVTGCFPEGVCWRSRRDNPVNKWYFERARGTWKIPSSNWTMFWTTENVAADSQTFLDYEGVCRTVAPSWADKQAVAD